jgi:hypothetical protein
MTLLNTANKLFVGASAINKVYAGANLVWQPAPAGITAPLFRSETHYNYPGGGSGMIYLTKPTGTIAGDILIAAIAHAKASSAQNDLVPNAGDGWAKIGTSTVVTDSGLYAKLEVWWKRAGASEPASYGFDVWGSNNNEGYIAAYSSCATSGSPIDAFSTNAANTGGIATGTGITTTQANDALLWIGHNWDAAGTLVPPTGMTERREYLLYAADQTIAAAGATGNRTQTQASSSPWATYMIALKGAGSVSLTYGPDESMYAPSAVPAVIGTHANTFSVGAAFVALAPGRITAIRYYRTAEMLASRIVRLWPNAGGAPLVSVNHTGAVVGWNTVPITPLVITEPTGYRVAMGQSGAAAGDAWPYTNSAVASVSPRLRWDAGVYSIDTPSGGEDDYPDQITGAYNYFVDVVYQEAGPPVTAGLDVWLDTAAGHGAA